ncbi:MAG TPA: DMT family transporter [Stellaceae bacterium]|nr:DMT family transporter [Stellaceae bacterium]
MAGSLCTAPGSGAADGRRAGPERALSGPEIRPAGSGFALPGRAWTAVLAAMTGSVMVGFLPIAARRLYEEGVTASSLLFWRYAIGLVAIGLVAPLAGIDLVRAGRRGALRLTLVGATLGAAQTLCYFESLHWLETGIAVLLFYTYPALTLVVERLLFRRPVQRLSVLCIATILIGAGLITGPGLDSGRIDPRGLLWALPGPLIYAFYLAANARLMGRHPPLAGAAFLYLGFALSYLAVVVLYGLDRPASAVGWAALVFIALGAGALSITLFSYAVPRLGPSSYAIVANTELVTVVLIGALVLGERLTANRIAGALLIAAGVLAHGLSRRRHPG